MTPDDLARLLDESAHAPQHSLRAALARVDGQPHPRIGALCMALAVQKRELWAAIGALSGEPGPPEDAGLTRLLAWEVQAARQLSADLLPRPVPRAIPWVALPQADVDVAALLRLSARLSSEAAGQILAHTRGPRWV